MRITVKMDNKPVELNVCKAYIGNDNRFYVADWKGNVAVAKATNSFCSVPVNYSFVLKELGRKGKYDLSFVTFEKVNLNFPKVATA